MLSVAAAVVLIAVITWLPQVGAPARPDGKVMVEVWSWDIAAFSLDGLVPAFTKDRPGVDVWINRSGANMQSRFLLSLAGGVGAPDVCQLQEREAGKFTATGRLFDLTEHASRYEDDFSPAFWASCQYDDKTYAIPWDIGPCAVFYKRWVFERYDIDPESIETWDDFIAVGQRLVEASNGKTKMFPLALSGLTDTYQMLIQQAGGGAFDEDGRIILQNGRNRRALEVLRALLDSGTTSPIEGPEYYASIGTDAVACYPAAVWTMQQIKDYAAGTEGQWGVFRLPAIEPGGLRTSNLGGSVLVIPDQGPDIEDAWRFIEYTNCRTDSQVKQYRDFGLFPAFLPALKDPYFDEPDPFFAGQRVHRLFTLDIERIPPLIRTRDWSEAERYFRQTLSNWAAQRTDHDAYLASAAKALSRKLGREVAPQQDNVGGVQ